MPLIKKMKTKKTLDQLTAVCDRKTRGSMCLHIMQISNNSASPEVQTAQSRPIYASAVHGKGEVWYTTCTAQMRPSKAHGSEKTEKEKDRRKRKRKGSHLLIEI